jgi:hypothetical protein
VAITIEDMKATKQFASVGTAVALLQKTEPVDTVKIEDGMKVQFKVAKDWIETAPKSELAPVDIEVSIDGKEFSLSKAAALAVGSAFGIQNTYSQKIPGDLYGGLLNYHFESLGSKAFSALTIGDTLHGLVRPGLSVYSNEQMLESVVEGIETVYGKDTEILVDRRTFNTLTKTDIRLVVPEVSRNIVDGGLLDVPAGEDDHWSAGIHITNSVTGKVPTAIQTYLFRYWCANGATVRNEDAGIWHRAFDSRMDVYDWTRDNTEAILSEMEKQFDAVQHLTGVDANGRIGEVVNNALKPLRVSSTIRAEIADEMLAYDEVSLYTIMNAITSYANRPGLDQDYINRFMTAGGNLASRSVTSEKAQVWKEGHLAPATAHNPYEIG